MPAHNVAPYVDEAVESILHQTFEDFELVVRDDGSNDGTGEKLKHWAARDSRVRFFAGERLGPAGNGNRVVELARAPLIARMDADDISAPDRLQRQVAIMEGAAEIGLLGTLCRLVRADGSQIRDAEYWRIPRRSALAPFGHSSVMFRRALFTEVEGYRSECDYWEDLDLYLRIGRIARLGVLAEPLVAIRVSPASTRLQSDPHTVEAAVDRAYRCVREVEQGLTSASGPPQSGEANGNARLLPMVFVSRATHTLWSGGRPSVLRKLLRRGRLRLDSDSTLSLVWASLASLSPGLLRSMIGLLVRARDRAARRLVRRGRVYEWVPFGAARGRRRAPTEIAWQRLAQEPTSRPAARQVPELEAGCGRQSLAL